jgi:hypothetical protein
MNDTEFYEKHLRTFPGGGLLLDHEDVPFFGSLPAFLRAVKDSLGLDIVFIRAGARLPDITSRCFTVKVEGGKSPGTLVLLPSDVSNASTSGASSIAGLANASNVSNPSNPSNVSDILNVADFSGGKITISMEKQSAFIESLSMLLGDAYRWQQTVRKYEEELASISMPVIIDEASPVRSSETLFNILKNGSRLLGCQAASFYVLNSDNKTLKLRSCWGLPEERLLDEPRLLSDSLADIEAMLGQAVILNEDYLFETWQSPESFPTAICVPVMSNTAIIGTLWFFADVYRDFGDWDRHLIETITGRISSELERSALERELAKKTA